MFEAAILPTVTESNHARYCFMILDDTDIDHKFHGMAPLSAHAYLGIYYSDIEVQGASTRLDLISLQDLNLRPISNQSRYEEF